MNNSEYVRVLMPSIPREAFEACPRKLIDFAICLTICIACWSSFRMVPKDYWFALALVIGMCLTCIAFQAHDVSHRSVVRHRFLSYPIEVLMWALVFVPATVWSREHRYHHIATNTVDDPKRRFLKSETSVTTAAYGAIFYPHKGLKYNILCIFYFLTTNARFTIAAFYPGRSKPRIVPSKPVYSTADKLKILFELFVIAAIQVGIFLLTGHKTIMAYLIPIVMVSAWTSVYFFTSHSLKPLRTDADVLEGTTSTIVPRIVDRLNSNISYHSEHHLFPHMNSNYYPLVSSLIQKHFPEAYQRIPMTAAWSQLWKLPLFITPPAIDRSN
jgi:fatty acid desaturase